MSHFATFPPVLSANNTEGAVKCFPCRRFLGIAREVNHKTSTQAENWIGLVNDICFIHKESPGGCEDSTSIAEIWSKATGFSADHAADQLKLSRELCAHKLSCMYQLLGVEEMKLRSEGEIERIVNEKFYEILAEIGNWAGWETRSGEERKNLLEHLINEVAVHFGELALTKLPERQQRILTLWFWSGCCMHKDLNTFKGGATELSEFWGKAGIEGPVKLLSREREEREELAGADTTSHEPGKASGGAAKLADLVGALLQNKEEDKGCPEEFRAYCEHHFEGEIPPFPDTSNTRFQCYGDASTELISHSDLYIGFLDQHGKAKRRGAGLNHMEKNILKGLMDPKTRTELAVFTLYSEAISKPYALMVRGSFNESKNALDLREVHHQILTHINILIDNPDLLIGEHTSHETGALYRTPWNRAIINYIHSIHNELPYLQQALVAFLHGARAKWVPFTKEFSPGSKLSNSTAEERLLSFRSPTNDHCEGAGAMWKLLSRHYPSMTTHQKNARLFTQLNHPDIETYSHNLPESDRAFARAKAREIDGAKLPAKEREAQARADREAADEEQKEVERLKSRREEKDADECRMIKDYEPFHSLGTFLATPDSKLSIKVLRKQLIWHRRKGLDGELPSGVFSNMKKASMKDLVVGALIRSQDKAVGKDTKLETIAVAKEVNRDENSVPQDPLVTCSQPGNSRHNIPPDLPGGRNLPPTNFGCGWDSTDYSCSYDCVFTAFTWMYLHAPSVWKEKWTRESAIAALLSHHFEKVSSGLSGPAPEITIPTLFAKGRDAWRDVLSNLNPTAFPRRGPVFISVTSILEVLAESRSPSHYATIVLSCGTAGCRIKMKNLGARYYMLTPTQWKNPTGAATLPEHECLETWIKKHYSSLRPTKTVGRCGGCQKPFSQKLVFREPTWIWLEVFSEYPHIIAPAFQISLGSATLRLAAVIYGNRTHYRARLHDPSGTWWFYDGQVNKGQPTPDPLVSNWGDLFQCGGGYSITALVYCLASV